MALSGDAVVPVQGTRRRRNPTTQITPIDGRRRVDDDLAMRKLRLQRTHILVEPSQRPPATSSRHARQLIVRFIPRPETLGEPLRILVVLVVNADVPIVPHPLPLQGSLHRAGKLQLPPGELGGAPAHENPVHAVSAPAVDRREHAVAAAGVGVQPVEHVHVHHLHILHVARVGRSQRRRPLQHGRSDLEIAVQGRGQVVVAHVDHVAQLHRKVERDGHVRLVDPQHRLVEDGGQRVADVLLKVGLVHLQLYHVPLHGPAGQDVARAGRAHLDVLVGLRLPLAQTVDVDLAPQLHAHSHKHRLVVHGNDAHHHARVLGVQIAAVNVPPLRHQQVHMGEVNPKLCVATHAGTATFLLNEPLQHAPLQIDVHRLRDVGLDDAPLPLELLHHREPLRPQRLYPRPCGRHYLPLLALHLDRQQPVPGGGP
ncbi:thiamine-phosphate kinase [Babesia caballi]|uniref:Thiamine-phosphate kinase n=1 Tax=Babesia caballi TaxID=5871 RepID=A0AAV4LN64_BABCB|nr:thiamine-phosphate kinase [Babesia caballi]